MGEGDREGPIFDFPNSAAHAHAQRSYGKRLKFRRETEYLIYVFQAQKKRGLRPPLLI